MRDTRSAIALHFSKMHGLGNDFVMLEAEQLAACVSSLASSVSGPAQIKQICSRLAAFICNRNFGVGADGLIVAIDLKHMRAQSTAAVGFYRALDLYTADYPGRDDCDIAWIYVNSDGSYSAMCGNGLRCLAFFVKELGWPLGKSFSVATSVYPVTAEVIDGTAPDGTKVDSSKNKSDTIIVRTRLAGAKYATAQIPMAVPAADRFIDQPIKVAGRTFLATCISMGNPHCVLFEQDGLSLEGYAADIKKAHADGKALQKFPDELLQLADDIQKLSIFPEGVNVEFVRTDADRENAWAFIVERGCGATLACASGAAAVLAAGVISNRLNKKSYVILPGGKLECSLTGCGDHQGSMQAGAEYTQDEYIELTGPATRAFSGDVAVVADLFVCDEGGCL